MSLEETINHIKQRNVGGEDESSTKQGWILPIFQDLGWKFFNTNEVCPEYATGTGKVDYSLMINNKSMVFVEAKKTSENLEKHEKQLLRYSFEAGVKLAILTNGLEWWFYLPLLPREWSKRRFYTIDIKNQDTKTIVESFEKFLNKNLIKTEEAYNNAEITYENKIIEKDIKKAIPKAWKKLINENNEELYKLISDETEKLTGHKPEDRLIEEFTKDLHSDIFIRTKQSQLTSNFNPPTKNENTDTPPKKSPITRKSPQNDRIINSFIFNGREYIVSSSRDVLLQLMSILHKIDKYNFHKIFELEGRNRPYFSENPNDLRNASLIQGTDIYAETNRSTSNTVEFSYKVLNYLGYPSESLEIIYSNNNNEKKKQIPPKKRPKIQNSPQKIKKIKSFTFNGKEYPITVSRNLISKLFGILYSMDESKFNKVFELKGRNKPYFSKDLSDFSQPKLIEGTDIYIGGSRSTSNIVDFAYKVLSHLGYNSESLKINYFDEVIDPNEKTYIPPQNSSKTLNIPKNIKAINSFTFNGKEYPVIYAKDVLLQLLSILYSGDKSNFNKVFELKGRNKPYFSKNPDDLTNAKLIEGTDIFAETNRDTYDTVYFSYKLLTHFGIPRESLEINYLTSK